MRFRYRAAGPIVAAAILTLLSGCSRTQHDWRTAQQAGTAQAYEVFVRRHPGSELAGVARQRIAQLSEEAAWQRAARENTAAAYQQYLAQYPNGSWSQDARIRMESRSLAAQAPQGASPLTRGPAPPVPQDAATPVPQHAEPPVDEAPVTAPGGPGSAERAAAAQASAIDATSDRPRASSRLPGTRSAAGGNARSSSVTLPSNVGGRSAVQLGAFSSVTNARADWSQLSSKFQAQLRGLTPRVIPVTVSGRRLYRLEAGVASQAAARRLCHQLQQHSQGCLPVP